MSGDIETYYDPFAAVWKNRAQDGQQLPGVHNRRGDAIARGRAQAITRRSAHVIRNVDGTLTSRRDHGHDPCGR